MKTIDGVKVVRQNTALAPAELCGPIDKVCEQLSDLSSGWWEPSLELDRYDEHPHLDITLVGWRPATEKEIKHHEAHELRVAESKAARDAEQLVRAQAQQQRAEKQALATARKAFPHLFK